MNTRGPHPAAAAVRPGFWRRPILHLLKPRVTGIPLTEQKSLRSKGAARAEYERTTTAFFYWLPKKTPTRLSP